MAYCDYIAHLIRASLMGADLKHSMLLDNIGITQFDVDADGTFKSTKKTIEVKDIAGKKYTITIEEAR